MRRRPARNGSSREGFVKLMAQSNSRYHGPCDARRSLSILHFAPIRIPKVRLYHLNPVELAMRLCNGKEPGGIAALLGLLQHNSQGAHALGMKRAVVMREHLPNLDIAVAPTDGR
jgi:hypothetical protein